MSDLATLLAVLAGAVVLAWVWRARDGKVRVTQEHFDAAQRAAVGANERVTTLVQFSASGCAPCVSSQRVLEELALVRDGVEVRIVDVASAPDLARAHHVLRAPTVLVVAPGGAIRARVSGVPAAADLAKVLDQPPSMTLA